MSTDNNVTPITNADLYTVFSDIETAKIEIDGATTALGIIEDDLALLNGGHIERDGMYQIIRLIMNSLRESSEGLGQALARATGRKPESDQEAQSD